MNLDLRGISQLINEKEPPQKGRILASALFMETILISLAVWELGLTQSKVTIPETLPNMQLQLIQEENKNAPVTEKKASSSHPKVEKRISKPIPKQETVSQKVAPHIKLHSKDVQPIPLEEKPPLPSPVKETPASVNSNISQPPVNATRTLSTTDSGIQEDFQGEEGYTKSIVQEIERHKIYPETAKELDITGSVTLSYQLNRAGQVLDVKIVKSSGFSVLDQAAVLAVRNSHFGSMKPTFWPKSDHRSFTTTIHFTAE